MKSLEFFKPTLATTLGIELAWLLSVRPAEAGYTVTLQQVGADVAATGSGAINLTGLTFFQRWRRISPEIFPGAGRQSAAALITGPTSSSVDIYSGAGGPTSFGSGGAYWSPAVAAATSSGYSIRVYPIYSCAFSLFQGAMSPVPFYRTARPTAARRLQLSA